MTKRTYAKFQPDDRPKRLPPAGHHDWEEYYLPERPRLVAKASPHKLLWLAVVGQAVRDSQCRWSRAVRQNAIEWLTSPNRAPQSFIWACGMTGLDYQWILSRYHLTNCQPEHILNAAGESA